MVSKTNTKYWYFILILHNRTKVWEQCHDVMITYPTSVTTAYTDIHEKLYICENFHEELYKGVHALRLFWPPYEAKN